MNRGLPVIVAPRADDRENDFYPPSSGKQSIIMA